MSETHCSRERSLKLPPAYLGANSVAKAVKTARGQRVLWLESSDWGASGKPNWLLRIDGPIAGMPIVAYHTAIGEDQDIMAGTE